MGKRRKLKVGDKVNRLTILELYNKYEHNQNKTYAKCQCDCGNITHVKLTEINQERTKSCGCLKAEKARDRTSKRNYKHGKSNQKINRLYRIWAAIKTRCDNSNSKSYHLYGGRGIKLCKQWYDYQVFEKWALTHGYDDSLTIDRINVDGDYKPSNCRWETRANQAKNRRNTIRINSIFITAFNETKTLPEWLKDSRCSVKSKTTICYRIGAGWSPEDALTKSSERK